MRDSGSGAPLAVGVIGCGWIARAAHLPLLARMPGARVAAVADPDAGCRAAAARLAPGAAAYADYEQLLDASGIDAVIIAAPSGVHAAAATAAVERGRHVYLEKPLATTLADGRRLLAAWRRSGVVGMTGFNYRYNPLYERTRQLLRRGELGPVTAVRSVFATAPHEVAAWKRARASGGGVLLDLGSHHVDLVRHWLGAEVRSVSASVRSVRTQDDTATLSLELGDGTLVQSLFSLAAVEDDRFEVYGERGRLGVDRLASLTVHVDPPVRGPGDRLRALARAAQGALNVGYALRKRRSPLHEPSFGIALAHFVAAARAGTLDAADAPSFEDGYAALAVIVAAEESARTGRSVPVLGLAEVADAKEMHSCRPERSEGPARAGPSVVALPQDDKVQVGNPDLSVILVTPDDFATVRRTFQHLRAQTIAERIEVVLVAPRAADVLAGPGEIDGFHSVQGVETDAPITSSAAARAVGIRAAAAAVVALGEDHSFPDPGWAAALLSAHANGHAVVGPTVRNGNPGTMLSWANLLLEYGPWLDPADAGLAEHLPGHNSSYKRDLLLSYGDELPRRLQVETVLQQDLVARGHTLLRTADAWTSHLNFSVLIPSLALRFLGGRLFAGGRARRWTVGKRAMYTLGAPLIPVVRLRRMLRTMARVPEQRALVPRILPMLVLTLLVDAAGELVGYALGAGDCDRQLSAIEFSRPRFLNARDRADYEAALRGARSAAAGVSPPRPERVHA